MTLRFFGVVLLIYSSWAFPNQSIPGKGLEAEGQKQWQEAISIYMNHLLQNPNNIELWLRVATIEYQQKNYNLAINAYKRAYLLAPNNPVIAKNLSEINAELNYPGEALYYINEAVKLKPNDVSYLQARAQLANWNNAPEMALDSYQRLLVISKTQNTELNPIELLTAIGSLQSQLHHYPQSVQAYSEAITLKPDDAKLHQTLSQIYAANNQPAKALEEIDHALKIEPDNIEYLKSKAQFAYWLKNNNLALQTYQKILLLGKTTGQPISSPDLITQIGSLYNQAKEYSEAIKLYQQTLLTHPDNAMLYFALSQTYAAANSPQDALAMINKALQLKPDNIEYLKYKEGLTSNSPIELVKTLLNSIINPEEIVKPLQIKQQAPSQLEEYINLANNEASLRHYGLAATAIKKAIRIKPNAKLYKQLSEIYAMANQPQQALEAINQALKFSPANLDYWRAKAKLAAWANNKVAAQESYEAILRLKPYDQDAMLNLAHVLAWRGETDLSLCAYKNFLRVYPQIAEGWIQYAEVLSWIENYTEAFNALSHYKRLGGDEFKYLKIQAKVLASAGRFQSALKINQPLLREKPADSYLLITEVNALNKALDTQKALVYLKKVNEINPDDPQVKGLNQVILTPLRSNINVGTDYTSASDTTRIRHIPTLSGQYFLSPTTSLLLQGIHEHATAAIGSGLETINGKSGIYDESLMVGFGTQIPSILNFKGVAGMLKIQGKNEHGIYDVGIGTNLGETVEFDFQSLHNLYRPYLIPQSPRLISLQIMESRNGIAFQWQPFIHKYLNVVVSHSDLSDNNGYWHTNIWPKTRVFSSQNWQVSLGVNADTWRYKRRANDGYFSPLLFKGYEGTIDVYYGISENVGLSCSGGFGMQKDETFPHYYYEEDLSAQLFLGIFTDWELKINGGYTLRINPQNNNYRSWNTGLILTRRF